MLPTRARAKRPLWQLRAARRTAAPRRAAMPRARRAPPSRWREARPGRNNSRGGAPGSWHYSTPMERVPSQAGVAGRRTFPAFVLSLFAGAACGPGSHAPDVASLPASSASLRPAAPSPSPVAADAGSPAPELPKAIAFDGFAEGDRIADLSAVASGERMLLAWVTYFDEGSVSMRKTKPARGAAKGPSAADAAKQGASVYVRALDKDAEALAPAKVVSSKAISIGGVALARGADAGGAALAWVGKDAGLGQVFVTKITDAGDKQAQRMITHSKAGCSDVGLAA